MSPVRRRLVSFALGLVVVGALWAALTLSAGGTGAGTRAPSFSVARLGGGPRVSLPLVGEGAHDPVVLTFFASWCGPCHAELPLVAEVARQAITAHPGVVFLGIDGNDAASSGLAFARRSGVGFAVGKDFYSEVGPSFGINGYPGTVFIDGTDHIVKTVTGPVTRATLEHWLAVLAPA